MRALALVAPPTPDNVALVERFLYSCEDDWDLQGVIYALCSYWGLTDKYLSVLEELITAEKWNRFPSAALAAFSVLGEHLDQTKNTALCARLIRVFDEDLLSSASGRFSLQHLAACYSALDRGVRGTKALFGQHRFKSVDDINPEIIKAARQLAGSKKREA